jgi:thioredoxin-related protein
MRFRHVRSRVIEVSCCLALLCLPACNSDAQNPDGKKPASKVATKRPSIYDKNADAQKQHTDAASRASRENKRVLVMFGGDWCGWCHKLHDLFTANAEIRKLLLYEYELVMVDTKAPHAETLLKECSKGQAGVGFPFLAVFDSAGKLLYGQKTDPLEEGDHHDPKKVKDFLARWVAEPKDAVVVLADALAKASSDDKKVFLSFGAPWCGWCHRLENFVARPEISTILDRDFVVLKIDVDRMKNGKEVMEKYRSGDSRSGGIPWIAILSGKGEKLATSDLLAGPNRNIGYPAEPKEIDAFLTMIEGQAQRIEPAQAALLRRELNSAGEKIIAEMKARAAEAKKKSN